MVTATALAAQASAVAGWGSDRTSSGVGIPAARSSRASSSACRHRLLGKEDVEACALGHEHERKRAHSFVGRPVAEPELDPVDHVFDDRPDREREPPDGANGETTPAGLVARKPGAVEQEDGRSGACQPVRRQRSGGAGADDDDVEALDAGNHTALREPPEGPRPS